MFAVMVTSIFPIFIKTKTLRPYLLLLLAPCRTHILAIHSLWHWNHHDSYSAIAYHAPFDRLPINLEIPNHSGIDFQRNEIVFDGVVHSFAFLSFFRTAGCKTTHGLMCPKMGAKKHSGRIRVMTSSFAVIIPICIPPS